jgi:hypothetical protein
MIASRQLGRQGDALDGVKFEQVSLSGGFYQPFPPWSKDITAVELQLPEQFLDGFFVLLDGLSVELRGLIERDLEVLNLLSEPVQQVVTLARISRS